MDCLFGICSTIFGGICDAVYDCACGLCSCGSSGSGSTNPQDTSGLGNVLIFILVGIVFITTVYLIVQGIQNSKKIKAKEEEELNKALLKVQTENERKWAEEAKQKALEVSNKCAQNSSVNTRIVSTEYQTGAQMNEITKELTNAAELQGKIASIVDELTKKGGAL